MSIGTNAFYSSGSNVVGISDTMIFNESVIEIGSQIFTENSYGNKIKTVYFREKRIGGKYDS